MYDEEILSVKKGRMVPDDHKPPSDEETKREETRKTCALRYLESYPDTKVIDPIKDNFPACTMPLSATAPLHVTPEILCNQEYAQEDVEHVALIQELLDQASLSTNHTLLMRSSNQLLRSLGGLLKGASDCKLAREPIPVWNIVKIVRTNSDADRVRKTIAFQCSDGSVSISLPSAPMPVPHFWKSSPPAIHMAVLKYRLYIDPVQSANRRQWSRLIVVGQPHYLEGVSMTLLLASISPLTLVTGNIG